MEDALQTEGPRSQSTKKKHKIVIKDPKDWSEIDPIEGGSLDDLEPRELQRDVVDVGTAPARTRLPSARRRLPAKTPLAAPKLRGVQSARRKPAPAQVSAGVHHVKRRKRASLPILPNSRLYQPAPPRSRYPQPAPPRAPSASRAPRLSWPKFSTTDRLTASSVIVELTEQIANQQKQQQRLATKRHLPTPKKPFSVSVSDNGRPALVVTVPTVGVLAENSSPERDEEYSRNNRRYRNSQTPNNGDWCERREGRPKVISADSRSSRSPSAFRLILEALDSPIDESSVVEDCEKREYSPTSSYFREDSPNKSSPNRGSLDTRAGIASSSSLFREYVEGKAKRQELPAAKPKLKKKTEQAIPPKRTSTVVQRGITSTSSLFKAYFSGSVQRQELPTAKPPKTKKKLDLKNKANAKMSSKERGSQHSTSPEDFSDGNETLSAPSEFLAEFMSAIMRRRYVSALKYCKLILQYEPNNLTAKEFYPLLEEKLKTADIGAANEREEGSSGAEAVSADGPLSAEHPAAHASGSSSPERHRTDEKDEGSSYNSDDSYLLDDELEEEEEEEGRGGSGDGAGAESPPTSSHSRSRSSPRRAATDSDRSLPFSAVETDNSANNLSGSGYEDEDSSKFEMDDDNGNAVSVSARHLAAAAGARFAVGCEDNDNDNATTAGACASNDNYRKQQEELRQSKVRRLRSQFVHGVN